MHDDDQIVSLTINGELIETTADHSFYTDDGYWIDASELQPGEMILSLDGDYGVVESVVVVEDANQPMFNLTVDDVHTFIVGDGDWVVHNDLACIIGPGAFPNEGMQSQLQAVTRYEGPGSLIVQIDKIGDGLSWDLIKRLQDTENMGFLEDDVIEYLDETYRSLHIDMSKLKELDLNATSVYSFFMTPGPDSAEGLALAASNLLVPNGRFYAITEEPLFAERLVTELNLRGIMTSRTSVRPSQVWSGQNLLGQPFRTRTC